MPADASFLVGEFDTQSSGSVRYFQSPPLTAGKTYAYEFHVEANREGQTVSAVKRVLVKAGQNLSLTFLGDDAQAAQAVAWK